MLMTKIKAGASQQQEELAMKMMAKDATRSINRDDTHFGLGNRGARESVSSFPERIKKTRLGWLAGQFRPLLQ